MSRSAFALIIAGLVAAIQPAAAFWPRSQLIACSEATREADYRRWRCWELDAFEGAPAFIGGAETGPLHGPGTAPRDLPRRGGVVRRLG